MTLNVIVSSRARAHLRNISGYTIKSWGKAQEQKYVELIKKVFQEISKNPEIGCERPEIAQGIRSLVAGKHVVVYQIGDNRIEVLGVVHGKMDLKKATRN